MTHEKPKSQIEAESKEEEVESQAKQKELRVRLRPALERAAREVSERTGARLEELAIMALDQFLARELGAARGSKVARRNADLTEAIAQLQATREEVMPKGK